MSGTAKTLWAFGFTLIVLMFLLTGAAWIIGSDNDQRTYNRGYQEGYAAALAQVRERAASQ